MKRHIIICLSSIILIVGFGIALLIVPLVVKAASGSITQTTATDFNQCTTLLGVVPTPLLHSTEVSATGNNILLVTTNFTDDFNGPVLDGAIWDNGNWTGTNVPLVSSSILTVPTGTWVRSANNFTYGVLQFEAEFGTEEFQHIGFASADFAGSRFFIFSTGTGVLSNTLFARANNNQTEQSTNLGAIPTGMHLYRIEWKPVDPDTDHVDFYMDGGLVAGFNVLSNNAKGEARNFFAYVSNNSPISSTLQVDWIQLLPGYFPGGFYTSCALDAGVGNGWQTAGFSATLPALTGVALEARTSLTGSTWSDWQTVSNGGVINTLGRYAQYRLNLASTDVLTTPLVDSVVLTYNTAPLLSINDVIVPEGNAGPVSAVFTVTLSSPISQTVVMSYTTANGTAVSPDDYTGTTTGTLTFAPGVTTQNITVTVQGDTLDENNETFFVNLSGVTNVNSVTDSQGQATITDDDLPPNLSINDVGVGEGTGGSTNAVFNVSLSSPSGKTITVNYATANGTATSPADYTGITTSTLTFAPGVTTQLLTVTVQADNIDEENETFLINLSGNTNAGITDNQGQGTITDDDGPPSLSINNVSVAEGSNGTVNAVFTVSLSPQSGKTVSVNYATANNSAIAPGDYITSTGTLTFTPGTITKTIAVAVNGDGTTEPDENFDVNLSVPTNANITPPGQGLGTILNDDVPGVALDQSASSTNVAEGGATDSYQVHLTNQPAANVAITLATNGQITALPTPLTFTPATWFIPQTVTVTAVDDGDIEANPHTASITHTISSTDLSYSSLSVPNITVSITDNDGKLFLPIVIK